jgi:TRAP-type C4-dicarboxylate transport system permease small subunit
MALYGAESWIGHIIIIIIIIIIIANGFVRGGSGTAITHITQDNTTHSNKTQRTELQTQ